MRIVFLEMVFGPEKFSGLSRNGPQERKKMKETNRRCKRAHQVQTLKEKRVVGLGTF